ncbi:hypothetical protein [Serratia aquatilis]|uniref:Uncharacterized protein n=1 Tax=Serratia aquatilis TaxID=1737515 RepID=A0ABV6EIT4_9GAMM
MNIGTFISSPGCPLLSADESKIPWDGPAFSQRMLDEGKLFAQLAEKSKSPEGSPLSMQFKKGIN